MKQITRLIIALIFITGILLSFILYITWPLLTGTEVVLATQPVDPFDLFRGQYLTINYEISSIPSIEGAQAGDNVYVSLKEDKDGIWRYDSASLTNPDNLAIRGKIKSVYGNTMRVEYGIEQYFFERGAEFSTQNLTVEARISQSGGSSIVQLLQNGSPLEMEYKEIGIAS